MEFLDYLVKSADRWSAELLRHLFVIIVSLPISTAIGVPLGIYAAFHKRVGQWLITLSSVLMTIPSLALFGVMVIILAPFNASLGIPPAVFTLVLYSLLPTIRNTMLAVQSVDANIIESARGMGMTRQQILFKIRLPLSLPILLAGLRTVLVMGVGVITMAQLVGAGGLGYFIFTGISRSRIDMVVVGAVFVALLGLTLNYLLIFLEKQLTPKGVSL